MAGAFDAKVDISTKEATAGLQALRKEVTTTSAMLLELDKALKTTSGDLKTTADSLTKIVAAQRSAAAGSKELAQAQIAEARAAGIKNVADAKSAQLTAAAGAQDAARNRNLAQGELATTRAAESETRRGIAVDRAAQATARSNAAQQAMNDGLSNSRYLMYDVGATYGVLAAGLMAIPAATAAVAAAYQRDFAQVIRVNEDLQGSQNAGAAQALKDSLKTMATDMPIAFDELSRITQLGAQMGIANDKLAQFTDTTAKFVAVTGISADTGATLFGRMESSFTDDVAKYPDYFERLGSSIAKVGADTVATDPEISSMLSQIGPLGAAAGFSSANITGLAAALASVRVQPELARGTLTRVFGQLNRDVAEGSPRMAEFGKVMNITGDQAAKLWQTDSSKFFTDLMAGLQKVQSQHGELTTTFDKLGITASRDVSALTKLAVGYDVLDTSMKSANKGFADGTALNDMSKITFDTIISKLTEMSNAWKNLADTLGGGALAPLAIFVDMAKNMALGIDSLVKHVPAVGVLISALMGIAAVTAAFLGFKAAQAFVMAGMIGFQQAAAKGLGSGLGLVNIIKTLAQTMLMAKGATDAQSRAVLEQVGAMRGLMIATSTSASTVRTAAASTDAMTAASLRGAGGIKGLGSSLLGLVGGPIGIAVTGLALLIGAFVNTKIQAEQTGKAIAEGMQQSSDAGARAVAEAMNSRKVNALSDGAIGFTDVDKTVTQIADRAGVAFQQIVDAVAKGDAGMKTFKTTLEGIAHDQGFKTLDDFLATAAPGNKAADIKFIAKAVDEAAASSKEQAKGLAAVEAAAPGAKKGLDSVGDGSDETATKIDAMTKALKDLNDQVFGTISAEADLQDSMSKLGEGLQKSAQFTPNSEGGRTNLKNLQDTLSKARDYYKQSIDDQTMTAQQAAQGYSDFVAGLLGKIKSMGGDTSAVDALANNTKARFQAIIGGAPVSVPVAPKVEAGPVLTAVKLTAETMQQVISNNSLKPTFSIDANTDSAQSKTSALAVSLSQITGYPYAVVMDALTNPAAEKSKEIYNLITSITNGTYVAPIGADTSVAISNVQNFSNYARQELANLQTAYNNVLAMSQNAKGFLKGAANDVLGKGWDGKGSQTYFGPQPEASRAAAPAQVAADPVAAPPVAMPNFGGLQDGYNKAADAANKAGDAGKKAGKDMANGIDDATAAAEDYANRLKTALTSAYNQQYGLTKATDDYHSALNAITKKREDEIAQVKDLRDKLKELNNERNKELITANKAKIEQNISLKYGETARADDYGNQAQTALDNAAAKQKDITATKTQADTIAAGIGKLTGYSDAAIANREALRGLESKMLDMVSAYAATGASQQQVRAYAQRLTAQFKVDAGQVSSNRGAINGLTGDMGRYIKAINGVPRIKPTTVTANTGGALNAINGVKNALNGLRDREVGVTFRGGLVFDNNYTSDKQPIYRVIGKDGQYHGTKLFNKGGQVPTQGFAEGGQIPGTPPSDPSVDNLMAQVDGKGMIRVRSNEFIQPEPAVKHYGLDFMNAIRTMSLPKFNMGGSPSGGGGSSSGSVASGPTVVQLTAENIAAIQRAGDRPVVLFADSVQLAKSVNEGNVVLAQTGAN